MGRLKQFCHSQLVRRLFFMSVTVGSTMAAQIGVVVVLAHVFGAEGMGEYAYHYAIASFFGLISVFGFPIYLQRELAARPDDFYRIHSDALSFKLLLDASLLVVSAALPLVFKIPNVWLFYIFVLVRFLMAYNSFFLVEFRVLAAFKTESILTAAGNLLYFFFAFIIATLTSNLNGVALGFLVAQAIVLVCVITTWRAKSGRCLLAFSTNNLSQTFRKNLPYALDQGLVEFLGQITSFLIGLFLGNAMLGVYQAGLRIANGVLTLASIVMGAFISKLSEYWSSNRLLFRRESNRAALIFHSIAIGAFLFFWLGGPYLTQLLYTPEFNDLNELWPLFGLYVASRYLASVPGILLTASGQQKQRVWVNIFALAVILSLFYISVEKLGLIGVIFLIFISQVLILIIYKILASKLTVRPCHNVYDTPVYLLFVGITCYIMSFYL